MASIQINSTLYLQTCFVDRCSINLTLEGTRGEGGFQSDHPLSIFLALNFCSLTDYQKLWHNCSLFVKTSFDSN